MDGRKKKRGMTFNRPNAPFRNLAEMDENLPLIDFFEFYDDSTRTDIDQMSFDAVVDSDGNRLEPILPEIINQFETEDVNGLLSNPPPPLIKLKEAVNSCLPYDIVSQMIHFWPPLIPTDNLRAKSILYFLLKIIQDSKYPMTAVLWCSNIVFNMSYYNQSSSDKTKLKGICICGSSSNKNSKKSKDDEQKEASFSWADIDFNDDFAFYVPSADNLSLRISKKGACSSIVVNKGNSTIQIKDSANNILKEFTPLDPKQLDYWGQLKSSNPPPFALMLSNIHVDRPLPSKLLPTFYRCLTSDDLLILRALLYFKVTKSGSTPGLMEALFDAFSYAGKVSELILATAIIEFQSPNLSPGTILRGTSQLSNLLKVFYEKFGIKYIQNSLAKAIKFIDKTGNLSLKNPSQSPVDQVYEVLFKVLKHILKSIDDVPPEMRHMASILKSLISLRFNNKQIAYNVLNNFFYLRFINAYMVLPQKVGIEVTNDSNEVLIPFASLLGYVFNLQPMKDKYEAFSAWNDRLTKHTFNDIIDFVFSICDIEEVPTYEPPPKEKLLKSLELILSNLSKSHEAFCTEYNRIITDQTQMSVPSWVFGTLLQRYFQENVTLFYE